MKTVLMVGLTVWLGTAALSAAESPAGPTERPAGTGVIVHGDGYVLTAHHVVANSRRIVVVTPGEFRAPALIVGSDPEQDLALLKIETVGLSESPIGYAGAVKLDQEVIVAGYPFGLREVSISHGRISAVRTKGVKRVFQVDAAINPGNSGGPVFNRQGEIVGLVTTKFSHPSGIIPEGMGFAVPISYALPLLANIPDFDFQSIGKGQRDLRAKNRKAQGRNKEIVRSMSRTTVRIETMRLSESVAAIAGTTDPKVERVKPDTHRPAAPKTMPESDRDGPAKAQDDPAALAKANEELISAQREAMRALTEKGVLAPEEMVLIPAGEFVMGEENGHPDVRPMHRTTLHSYWIGKYEVTNARYRPCVSSGVCSPPKDRSAFDDPQRVEHPVTNITWKQAHAYCQWLGRRLPTEAEWEKAARGTDGRRYPWGNSEEAMRTWIRERSVAANGNGTSAVGSVPEAASPYGAFDVVGNVWEWVRDWYAEDYMRERRGTILRDRSVAHFACCEAATGVKVRWNCEPALEPGTK